MAKSKKSKILAAVLCAGVMAGMYASPVMAGPIDDERFEYKNETITVGDTTLNNPEIHHTEDKGHLDWDGWVEDWQPVHPDEDGTAGDTLCAETVANAGVKVGDLNSITAALVDNDKRIKEQVDSVSDRVTALENSGVGGTDTDTHVQEGAATVADNGDVTMNLVDKNGDTGKDVTITGLASDKELADAKAEITSAYQQADRDLQNGLMSYANRVAEAAEDRVAEVTGAENKGQLGGIFNSKTNYLYGADSLADAAVKLDTAIGTVDGKVEAVSETVTGVDNRVGVVEEALKTVDTDTHLHAGEHKVIDNKVEIALVDKDGKPVYKDGKLQQLTITGVASEEYVLAKEAQLKEGYEAGDAALKDFVIASDNAVMNRVEEVTGAGTKGDLDGMYTDTNYLHGAGSLADATVKLDTAIGNEVTDREKADQQLQANIDYEAALRQAGDKELEAVIATKEAESKERDNYLDNRIDQTKDTYIKYTDAEGNPVEYEVKADGTVALEVVSKDNKPGSEEVYAGTVTIKDVASKGALDDLTAAVGVKDAGDLVTAYGDTNYINKAEADSLVEADIALDKAIADEATARENADKALQKDIYEKEEQSKKRDAQLQANIDAEAAVREQKDTELQKDIYEKEEQSKYRDQQLQNNIDTVNGRVDRLESRVDDLDDRIGKVGAMSAAIANLHTMGYDPAAPTEIAVGVGQYRDDTGLALGMFHYPNRDFMLSLSVSTAGDEFMGGIGATWKLGRKSPEKVAAIKQAQAEADMRRAEADKLAKAQAMQEAAKEAKVRAQMERHAKMAAEQAAE